MRGEKFVAIREVLADEPNLRPAQVIRRVRREYNLKVSQSSVQRVRQHMTGTLPPSVRARTEKVRAAPTLTVSDINEVRTLATRLGGIDRLVEVARAMGLAA